MEKVIEVKDFHNVTLPAIPAPFAISWSEDNKITVNTSTALHIVEVCPNPLFSGPGICIKRTMVKPFTDMPSSEAGIDVEALIWKLEQSEVYNIVLDVHIAPMLKTTKPLDIRMKQTAWSPAGMFQDQRCLLACLTNMGCVKIFAPHQTVWPVVMDISAHWAKYCKDHWTPINPRKVNIQNDPQQLYQILKTRTYQLNATAITWSNLMTEPEKYSFLMLGHLNGQVVVWKMLSVLVSIPRETGFSPVLIIDTKLHRITAIHWMNWTDNAVSLVVGDCDGLVKLVQLSLKHGHVSYVGMTDIWTDKDRMHVSCISSLPSDLKNDTKIIAVTKGSYIVAFLIRRNEVIARCCQLLGNLNITGLEVFNQDTFMASTYVGCVSQVHINHSKPQELTMEVQEITTNVNWKKYACFGIASGMKHQIWVIATSICKLYDHLVIRRPANIIFFYFHGKRDFMQSLIENKKGHLSHCWEYLEIIRVQCMKKYFDFSHDYLENPKDLELLDTYQLQMELWLAKISLTQTTATSNFNRQHQIGKYIHQLERLIFCRHACKIITKITSNLESLSATWLLTLHLMRAWVQIWLQSENLCWSSLQELATNKLSLPVPAEMPTKEVCSLCEEEIIMQNSWRYAVCKKSHRLPRCSWTLQQCVDLPYLVCRVCSAIALSVEELKEEAVCVFCDSPLILDDKAKLQCLDPIEISQIVHEEVESET